MSTGLGGRGGDHTGSSGATPLPEVLTDGDVVLRDVDLTAATGPAGSRRFCDGPFWTPVVAF